MAKKSVIAYLNDILRITFTGGKVVMTPGIAYLPEHLKLRVFDAIKSFKDFNSGNNRWRERDFGEVEVEDVGSVFWKIDYYDLDEEYHSENPADPNVTVRVMTIMLKSEY